MVTNLKLDMLEASNPTEAALQSLKQAVTNILNIESMPLRNTEDESLLTEAKGNVFAAIHELRVVDTAPFIKKLIEGSHNEGFKRGVLEISEDRIDDAKTNLNEKVIDTLALASIYESVDEKKSTMLNAQAYFFLGTGQNNKIDRIIDTLEHIQIYYSDAGDEREADEEFILSIAQMQDLDRILVAKTNDFLAQTSHDEDLADRLAYLLESHEDLDVSSPLQQKLFPLRTDAGRAEYIENALDQASEESVESDTLVTNPILARVGRTYGELFEKVGHLTCERERLNVERQRQLALTPL